MKADKLWLAQESEPEKENRQEEDIIPPPIGAQLNWAVLQRANLLTYRKSHRGDVFLGRLHQEIHPEIHQLLFGSWLLHAGFIEVLVD